jgi:hypothetical protein
MTSSSGAPLGLPPDDSSDSDLPLVPGGPDEYLCLSDGLKQLRGMDFENHGHPAVVLDRATPASTHVWGWWAAADPKIPCLLWASERGWSATIVEPGALDSEGYERVFWSHRINLLDLALANAIGPFPTLEDLEHNVAANGSFGSGSWAMQLTSAVLWGILQLRAAHAGGQDSTSREAHAVEAIAASRCSVDEELARHALVPSLAKGPSSVDAAGDPGMDALLAAIRRAAIRSVPESRAPSD